MKTAADRQIFFQFYKNIMGTGNLYLSDKIVLVLLHEYFDKDIAPFHGEIAETLGISRKTVQLAIGRLENLGYIERTVWLPDGWVQEVSKYRKGPQYFKLGRKNVD